MPARRSRGTPAGRERLGTSCRLHAHFPKCRHRLDPAAWSGDLCEEPVTFLGGGAGVSCFRMRRRSRTSPSRPACRYACPPVKPGAGAGESQFGDIGRGSGRRSYRQQPWLSSLSAVPQARCVWNPRRCQVLLTDRPECQGRSEESCCSIDNAFASKSSLSRITPLRFDTWSSRHYCASGQFISA
jgi:hypothetical protein